jgi:transcription antitermination protein NusB
MKSRTKARAIALQALYEMDVVQHPIGSVLEERLNEADLDSSLTNFIIQIVKGVYPLFETLDYHIAKHAPDWPFDQVAPVDRNILRIALWEIAVYKKTPVKVAINEAIELAKVFGSDSTSRFVNGVLGSLALSQNEISQELENFITENINTSSNISQKIKL